MITLLLIGQIIIACLIVTCVLLQAQGTGLGSTWGGGGETFHTKRGLERVIYYATMVLIAAFALISLAILTVR